jgi:hypothetical protein
MHGKATGGLQMQAVIIKAHGLADVLRQLMAESDCRKNLEEANREMENAPVNSVDVVA